MSDQPTGYTPALSDEQRWRIASESVDHGQLLDAAFALGVEAAQRNVEQVRAEAKAEERARIATAIEAYGGDARPGVAHWQRVAARIARGEAGA